MYERFVIKPNGKFVYVSYENNPKQQSIKKLLAAILEYRSKTHPRYQQRATPVPVEKKHDSSCKTKNNSLAKALTSMMIAIGAKTRWIYLGETAEQFMENESNGFNVRNNCHNNKDNYENCFLNEPLHIHNKISEFHSNRITLRSTT